MASRIRAAKLAGLAAFFIRKSKGLGAVKEYVSLLDTYNGYNNNPLN